MSQFIPVNEPWFHGNEKKYLCECIDTGWIGLEGRFVELFENQIAQYVHRKYAVAVTNGTSALELAVQALDIGVGDEVIMPTFTIISCGQAVIKVGAVPVLVDCDLYSFNMKVEEIEAKITSRTKAIMVAHIYGLPVKMSEVLQLAKRYQLKIIEDTAQALGQTYRALPCGSFGDISTFSFYPNKNVTTGEGGMVVMNDENLYERCKSLRNLCFSNQPNQRFIHREIGWNLRMSNLQGAVGVAQLEKIDEHLQKKHWIGEYYQKKLANLDDIYLPIEQTEYAKNSYWIFPIVLKDNYPYSAETVQKN